jgi:hypothetical protein
MCCHWIRQQWEQVIGAQQGSFSKPQQAHPLQQGWEKPSAFLTCKIHLLAKWELNNAKKEVCSLTTLILGRRARTTRGEAATAIAE